MPYDKDLTRNTEICKQLDFADYLQQYEGCTLDKKKSSGNWLILKDNSSGYHYRTIKGSNKGTTTEGVYPDGTPSTKNFDVIEFVKRKYNLSFFNTIQHIMAKKNLSPLIPAADPLPVITAPVKPVIPFNPNTLISGKPQTYLTEFRNIPTTILREPIFKDCIKHIEFKGFQNTAFVMFNSDNVIKNVAIKNKSINPVTKEVHSYRSFAEDTTHGLLCKSSAPDNCKFIIFSESMEDALAYYKLHHDLLKDKAMLVSSCGNLNRGQLAHLNAIATSHPDSKFILANDNDAAGYRFDLEILSRISENGKAEKPLRGFSALSDNSASTDIAPSKKFTFLFHSDSYQTVSAFKTEVQLALSPFVYKTTFSDINVNETKDNSNEPSFSVSFAYAENLTKKILNTYREFTGSDDKVLIAKPGHNCKDWSEINESNKPVNDSILKLSEFIDKGLDNKKKISADLKNNSLHP